MGLHRWGEAGGRGRGRGQPYPTRMTNRPTDPPWWLGLAWLVLCCAVWVCGCVGVGVGVWVCVWGSIT